MLSTVGWLAVSFLCAWHGRDRTWTPTFEGTRAERFESAARHYEIRMGLPGATVLVSDRGAIIGGKERCAWAWRDPWSDDVIGLWTNPRCAAHKPELLALHEQCHRRMAHLEPAFRSLPSDVKEREARECSIAYSAKERR